MLSLPEAILQWEQWKYLVTLSINSKVDKNVEKSWGQEDRAGEENLKFSCKPYVLRLPMQKS